MNDEWFCARPDAMWSLGGRDAACTLCCVVSFERKRYTLRLYDCRELGTPRILKAQEFDALFDALRIGAVLYELERPFYPW